MECERCRDRIDEGEEREYCGQFLCEDCYMDRLSPARTCDPWAIHSAKNLEASGAADRSLNTVQEKILDLLAKTGGMEPAALAVAAGLKTHELERELAALRHMEKIRGKLLDGGKRLIALW